MLILTRRIGESIIIGDNITLTVLGFNKSRQVKLGIDAPNEIPVHREEIFLKIKAQEAEGLFVDGISEDALEAPAS